MALKPAAFTTTSGAQLRAAYNAGNYSDFTTSAAGVLTIAPSGSALVLSGAVSGVTTLTASGAVSLGTTSTTGKINVLSGGKIQFADSGGTDRGYIEGSAAVGGDMEIQTEGGADLRLQPNSGAVVIGGAVSGITTLGTTGDVTIGSATTVTNQSVGINSVSLAEQVFYDKSGSADEKFTNIQSGSGVGASLRIRLVNDAESAGTNAYALTRSGTTPVLHDFTGAIQNTGAATLATGGAASSFGGALTVTGATTLTGNVAINGSTTTLTNASGPVLRFVRDDANDYRFDISTDGVDMLFTAQDSGGFRFTSLAGTGTRNVVVDANGVLSAP